MKTLILMAILFPAGVTDIREPRDIPAGEIVRGVGRQTILRYHGDADTYCLNFQSITPQTGGGVENLTIELATKGSGGIKLTECTEAAIRNVLVKPQKNGRTGGTGICFDGKNKGSGFCRCDAVTVMQCDTGLVLDTSEYIGAWCNRHSMTAMRFYGCGLGVDFIASCTNDIRATFETCDQPMKFRRLSSRNTVWLVEENCKQATEMEYGAIENSLSGIFSGYVRQPK